MVRSLVGHKPLIATEKTAPSDDLLVLMGPAGAGKSTLGIALSNQTGWPFLEGDDYHPPENKTKQANGVPLDDGDRAKWLDKIIHAANINPAPRLVLACSALTPYVQERLKAEIKRTVRLFLLLPPRKELQMRLENRTDHVMPASLLDDQLSALTITEDAIHLTSNAIETLCAEVLSKL